jgi:hypothetical protein
LYKDVSSKFDEKHSSNNDKNLLTVQIKIWDTVLKHGTNFYLMLKSEDIPDTAK